MNRIRNAIGRWLLYRVSLRLEHASYRAQTLGMRVMTPDGREKAYQAAIDAALLTMAEEPA
jgi:hypothetical protein